MTVMETAWQHEAIDDPAWAELWSHRARLVNTSRKLCPNPADAEDVAHEALVRAAAQPDLRPGEAGALLNTIVRNLCFDLYRRSNASPARRRYLASVQTAAASAEELACARMTASELQSCLDGLPESWRRALLMRAAGWSVGDIAEALGVSYKSAEAILARSRVALRSQLSTAS